MFILAFRNEYSLILLPEFSAVLGAEFIGTFRAFECHIAVFPESFGVRKHAHLPHNPDCKGKDNQRPGIHACNRYERRKHHHMIPVEYTAGRTAFILHYKSEWTPYQNAYEVSDLEKHGN